MSGRGIGVVGALFAAIDAGAKTWEDGGVWRRGPLRGCISGGRRCNGRPCSRLPAVAVLAIPLLVLATGLVAYPLSFLVQMVNVDAGFRLADGVRRHGAVRLCAGCAADGHSATRHAVPGNRVYRARCFRGPRSGPDITTAEGRNRDRGRWWARIIGAPWSAEPGLRHFRASLWQLFRGPATAKEPTPADLSRRYTELLFENLGQPGFRELIIATLDVETRGDLVFAAIGEARRPAFFQRGRGDLIDLSGVGRSQVFDALAAAMCVPVLTEPHLIAFSPESYWKGEAHRTVRSDRRSGATARGAGGGRRGAGDCGMPRLGSLGAAPADQADRLAAIARGRASFRCRDDRRSRRRRAAQEAIQRVCS